MAENNPNDEAGRKRPLNKENNATLTPTRPAIAGGKIKTPITNPYSSAKKKPKPAVLNGDDDNGGDDVEVMSPPPPVASRPVSSDGNNTSSQQRQEPGSATSDDCVVEWSNATNPLVDFPHGRPDCGVHAFISEDKSKFCSKCYCVVCAVPASHCSQWQVHCQELKQVVTNKKQQNQDVIDIEDSSPEQRQLQHYNNRHRVPPHLSINPAVQQYYQNLGPSVAALLDADGDDDDEDDFLAGNTKERGRRLYDDHYTNDFNHAYDNQNRNRNDKRNPKNQRITEVLAEKMTEALQLADKTPTSSASSNIFKSNPFKTNPNARNNESNNNGNKKQTAEEQQVTRNLQRKDRFERCDMAGDLVRLRLHKQFFVEGVRIGWPYPSILTPQRQMAIHLVKALKNSRHVVLESPTGTGKSCVLLTTLLAWQRHHAKSHWNKTVLDSGNISQLAAGLMGQEPGAETFPKIIYCSRTHSQVAQMVASLKKTPYRPRMTVLGSRDRLCIHREIRDKNPSGQNDNDPAKRKNRVNVNTACQMRVANTEKMRKQLWTSHDFRYDDDRPPVRLPGDGEGGNQAQQDSDDEDIDDISGEGMRSSEWILKKSTKKLTCPHYRQLSSQRTAQMTRTNFVATQDEIDCCKTGGEKSRLGSHDIEDLCSFGVNPYKIVAALYRNGSGEGFGLDIGEDCMIRAIHEETPAKRSKQLRLGDKIIQVNGKKTNSLKQVEHEIKNTSADLLELTILRGPAAKGRRAPGSTDENQKHGEVEIALHRSPGEKSFGITLTESGSGCEVHGFKDGPAARTDAVLVGDIILQVNGKNVFGVHDGAEEITRTENGPLRLRLRRAAKDFNAVDEGSDDAEEQEDLYAPHSPCPYYISRELSKHAELLFAPYNYILDPGIKRALDIDLAGTVVVLDEAHNVEGTLTESGSGKFGEIELSHLVSKLSHWASAAKSHNNLVDMAGGGKIDIADMAHELLLFVEKLVVHMRDLKARFEQSSGNLGAAKAIEEYHKFHTPDNKEFEVSYHGPNGHGVHRKAVGCKFFLESLDVSNDKITLLSKYSQALESHFSGSDRTQSNDSSGDGSGEKSVNNTFDLLNGLISKLGMASQTPEHFYCSVVIQANGNLDHAAGGGAENNRSGGRRFKKKPVTLPFVYPRNGNNPRAALHVCNHHKCKQSTSGSTAAMPSYGGPGVRHGDWCDGTDAPKWEAHLVLKLLFPGLLMKDLATKCRTVVLASGSLSPLQSVCAELDLQDSDTSKTGRLQTKPRPLEANHVVDLPKQLLAVAIGTFPNGAPLTVNYNNYKHPEFFARLGDALSNVIESIPRGGVLVFFPSYSVLSKAIKCWNPQRQYGGFDNEHSCPEIWDRLIASKGKVIVEPTGSQELFEQARDEYATTIKEEGSCVLLAVFRGKMSEGISFNDDNARGVICVGIPFPSSKDRGIVAKKAYNDEQRRLNKRTDLLPGQDWYAQEAFRAIAQALGRCIRHEADYGTVVLMDSRHCNDGSPGFVHSKLPKWMRHSVRTLSPGNMGRGENPILHGYRGLGQEMQRFFAQAPIFTKQITAKRISEYEQAQEQEKKSSSGHEFDSKTGGWTPAKCKTEPAASGVSAAVAMRVTQDSPVPPQMLLPSYPAVGPGQPIIFRKK